MNKRDVNRLENRLDQGRSNDCVGMALLARGIVVTIGHIVRYLCRDEHASMKRLNSCMRLMMLPPKLSHKS